MGINWRNLALLKTYATARGEGATLGDLVMYGRQHNTLSKAERARVASRLSIDPAALEGLNTEPLLRAVGAGTVTSIDVSDYEGCDVVLDLMEDVAARPDLAARLCARFDTILDYGTSEHVFNFPQTLVNTWNMLRDGGRYIFDLPVSGWVNHGLVQFTPSYFHSVGRTPYFSLQHIFFHHKHGIVDLAEFDSMSARRIHLRGKSCAWGVLTKLRPPGFAGPLTLAQLRVMQVELHKQAFNQSGGNRTYTLDTIADGFNRQNQAQERARLGQANSSAAQ